MRFLVDRCAGARLARWLASEGHDVVDSASWKQDPGDLALLQTAADDNRILVTIDQDFGVLVFAEERTHHGIVRLPDVPANERIRIFADLLARHADDLANRSVITVRSGRVRISRTPPRT